MEEWRDVPGRPGYIVSNEGRAAKLLTQNGGTKGYVQYPIPDGAGGRHREYLHTWVMLAFAGPRPEGAWILHKNDVKTDNRLENLRYGTPKENMADAFRNGRRKRQKRCKFGHLIKEPNVTNRGYCRACAIARQRHHKKGVPLTQELRDQIYRELT